MSIKGVYSTPIPLVDNCVNANGFNLTWFLFWLVIPFNVVQSYTYKTCHLATWTNIYFDRHTRNALPYLSRLVVQLGFVRVFSVRSVRTAICLIVSAVCWYMFDIIVLSVWMLMPCDLTTPLSVNRTHALVLRFKADSPLNCLSDWSVSVAWCSHVSNCI